jgi:two-component system phosphate regulon sensor histidine kinase PhoR
LSVDIGDAFLVVVFDSLKDIYYETPLFKTGLLICIVLIFIINCVVLELLFNYYGRKQVKGLSGILPQEIVHDHDENITIKELEKDFQTLISRKLQKLI